MAKQPDPIVADNGDILIPASDGHGGWTMQRVEVGTRQHRDWSRVVNERYRPGAPVWQIIIAVLLPIVGVVLAIWLFAKNRSAHGSAVLLASVLGFILATILLSTG